MILAKIQRARILFDSIFPPIFSDVMNFIECSKRAIDRKDGRALSEGLSIKITDSTSRPACSS
jgi:hypothetical protein